MKIPYCDCIDENWKALKARIQASLTAIKLNGKTYYQTDGTGICDLGTIEIPSKASEITLDDGRTVEKAIADDETAIAGKVNTVDIAEVTDGINMTVTTDTSTKQSVVFTVDDTLAVTGKTVGISDATDARIAKAQNDADTAQTTAEDAQADADNAMSAATTAQTAASTAMGKAETAIANAATAQSTADTAKTNAATAQATAVTAQATAETALEDAETAQNTADTAVANAKTAQNTADTAVANAATAQTTANNAMTKASNAQTDATTAISNAATAQATANNAQTIAITAKQTADTAIENAETAKTTAETADANADDALEKANSAVSTANSASSTASTAYQTAVTAKTTAETADGKADNAQSDATSALTKIKNAIVGLVTSVSGKVLNATITKSDGTTSTTPVFTAGNNLSWNGTTLNAVGGTAYEGGTAISLVDGAFNLNAGDGLTINTTDNTVNVDTATTDALDSRVTTVENDVATAQADADEAIVTINPAALYDATAQAYGFTCDKNKGSSKAVFPLAINTDDFAAVGEQISGITGTTPVLYISDAVKENIDTATNTANEAITLANSKQDSITGAAITVTSSKLTASRILTSNSEGNVAASSYDASLLAYISSRATIPRISIQSSTDTSYSNPTSAIPDSGYFKTMSVSTPTNEYEYISKHHTSVSTVNPQLHAYEHSFIGGLKVCHGSFYGYVNSTNYSGRTITLDTNFAFTNADSYTVIATIDDTAGNNLWSYNCRVKRVSGSQFIIYAIQCNNGNAIVQNCKINFIAIGV